MKNISLKLQEQILHETESLLEHLKTSRNKYINEAVKYYNDYHKRKLLEEQIVKESLLVSEDSMSILSEFENLEDKI
jgi:metal-responsive CopG/Arc/MetJ family transcriptional regulator